MIVFDNVDISRSYINIIVHQVQHITMDVRKLRNEVYKMRSLNPERRAAAMDALGKVESVLVRAAETINGNDKQCDTQQ